MEISLRKSDLYSKHLLKNYKTFSKTVEAGLRKLLVVADCEYAICYLSLNTKGFELHTATNKLGKIEEVSGHLSRDFVYNKFDFSNRYISVDFSKEFESEYQWLRYLSISLQTEVERALILPIYGHKRKVGLVIFINNRQEVNLNYYNNINYSTLLFSRKIAYNLRKESLNVICKIKNRSFEIIHGNRDIVAFLKTCTKLIAKSEIINYCYCHIRIFDSNKNILFESKNKHSSVEWKGFVDIEKSPKIDSLFESGEPIYHANISEILSDFSNRKWIERNGLESYACYPIKIDEEIRGVISVFLPYRYTFYSSDKLFLEIIAYEISSTITNINLLEEVSNQGDIIEGRGARDRIDILAKSNLIHSHKNDIHASLASFESLENLTNLDEIKGLIHREKQELVNKLADLTHSLDFDDVDEEEFYLKDIVERILIFFRSEIKQYSINLDTSDLQNYKLCSVKSDIREAIQNVIHNAIKAVRLSHKSNKEIVIKSYYSIFGDHMSFGGLSKDDRYITIMIEDNGVGMDSTPKIFNRGYSKFDKNMGTGMGLYYTNMIVTSYHGDIDIISSKGDYSQVYLHFLEEYIT